MSNTERIDVFVKFGTAHRRHLAGELTDDPALHHAARLIGCYLEDSGERFHLKSAAVGVRFKIAAEVGIGQGIYSPVR